MNSSLFICPVCRSPLFPGGKSYVCANRHSYDISREGYVNLLLPNQKQSREPGDSRDMVEARKSFLNKGYYEPLARGLTSFIRKYATRFNSPSFTILDAGCGEGYYTDFITEELSLDYTPSVYGIDISREGVKSAARRNSVINFAVAGIYNIPVADTVINLIISVFAPFYETEFSRILCNNGIIITVTPGAHHLYGLKKHLYDETYLNDELPVPSDNFYILETGRIKYDLHISGNRDIATLLRMTPYYYRTPPANIRSFLSSVNEINTPADFLIRIIGKNPENQ